MINTAGTSQCSQPLCCISSNPRLHRARETPKQISLKLAIDKEKNQVLFAESDIDFVDVLFSFLTLPMGTILKIDYLYKNVEALDEQFLQSKECKTMLLNPRSAHDIHCKNLVLKIDDTEPTKIYMCSKLFCPIKTPNKKAYCLSSMVENSECSCGQAMDKEVFLEYQEGIIDGNGVFMKGTSRIMFMITDDLHITPVSMSDSLAMFWKLRLESSNGIEVRTVTVDEEEVLHLLKRSLLSKTPMTDTFLSNEENTENAAPFEPLSRPNHLENRFRKMKVKLLINKSSRRVLCLEAKEDFMNLVLSFLTLPLGSIIRLLRDILPGSVDNLYKSVGSSKMEDFFNSTKSKDLLLNPKLPLHFSLNEQLPLKEEDPITPESRRCADCFGKNMVYLYPWGEKLCFMNPKLSGQEAREGGFIKKETLLLINDDLTIQPLSPINGILDLDKLKVLVSNSEEHEVEVGEEEVHLNLFLHRHHTHIYMHSIALTLLKASLISRSVLNHVFKPNDLGQMLG
ncbi:hypothetical protein AAG906_016561 [Vitis piasezkii]